MKREKELQKVLQERGLKFKKVLYNHFEGKNKTYEEIIDEMNYNIDFINDDIETVEDFVIACFENGCYFER